MVLAILNMKRWEERLFFSREEVYKRYYGGCEFVDIAENIARERAKKLFNSEYANVQPHSGSQANMAAYLMPYPGHNNGLHHVLQKQDLQSS